MKRYGLLLFAIRLFRTCLRGQLPRAAAQMSYYLLFSLFPLLLILVSAMGFFRLDVGWSLTLLEELSPVAGELLGDYGAYVAENASPALMAAGAVMAVSASSSAFRALMRLTGEVAGEMAFRGAAMFLVSGGMSLILLATIYLFLFAAVTGQWFLTLLTQRLGLAAVAVLWQWLRLPVVFALGVLAVAALYRFSLPRGVRAWPGAAAASVGLVLGTGIFSGFISLSSRYSLVYGSLANIMILMVWLFVCSCILLGGNVLNCLLGEEFTRS